MKVYPVTTHFDKKQIGEIRLMDDVLPKDGEYHFLPGGVIENGKYKLKEVSIIYVRKDHLSRLRNINLSGKNFIYFCPFFGIISYIIAQISHIDVFGWFAVFIIVSFLIVMIQEGIDEIF